MAHTPLQADILFFACRFYLSSQLQVILKSGQPRVAPGPELGKVGLEALPHLRQGLPVRFFHLDREIVKKCYILWRR